MRKKAINVEMLLVENAIVEKESYERRNTAIFARDSIPVSTTGENCAIIMINLIEEKLKCLLMKSILLIV